MNGNGEETMGKQGTDIGGIIENRFAPHADNPLMRELKNRALSQMPGIAQAEKTPAKPGIAAPPRPAPAAAARARASLSDIQRVVKSIEHLFTLPDHVIRIMNMLRTPNVNIDAIVREINKDPVLAAETLKVVNSGFYGFQHRISSIQHAIVIMGMHVVQSIVLSISVVDFFSLKKLWRHSLACGHACRTLARKAKLSKADELSVAGLLHDIGKAVFAEYMGEEYDAVQDFVVRNNAFSYAAEKSVIGVAHPEIGQWLLGRWNLPAETVEAVGLHHDFSTQTPFAAQIAAVHVADIVVNAMGVCADDNAPVPLMNPEALALLKLDMDAVEEIMFEVAAFAKQQSGNGEQAQ